jgi:hypothetical protein
MCIAEDSPCGFAIEAPGNLEAFSIDPLKPCSGFKGDPVE